MFYFITLNYVIISLSFQQYPEYDFGTQPIDTIHLSQRHSTGDNGYYTCTASIRLWRDNIAQTGQFCHQLPNVQ